MKFFKNFLLLSFLLVSIPAFANLPYHPIQLPRDDAGHLSNVPYPVKNLSEWWYYSGKLTTQEDRHFGYYLIIFNITKYVLGKKITVPLYTLQLTDIDNNKVYGTKIYYPNKETEFSTQQLAITLGKNKEVTLKKNAGIYLIDSTTQTKQGVTVKLFLTMKPTRNPLLVGGKGIIPMGNDTNSYYYSFTRLATAGSIQIDNKIYKINPSESSSWMDHQWGDFMLSTDNQWFWTSIRLDNNIDINLTNVLDSSKQPGKIKMANIMMPDGRFLFTTNFFVKPINHDLHQYPLTYDIEMQSLQLKMHITSLADHQDCNIYWEGISKVDGTYQGKPIHGFAYVENTSRYGWPLSLFIEKINTSMEQFGVLLRNL